MDNITVPFQGRLAEKVTLYYKVLSWNVMDLGTIEHKMVSFQTGVTFLLQILVIRVNFYFVSDFAVFFLKKKLIITFKVFKKYEVWLSL